MQSDMEGERSWSFTAPAFAHAASAAAGAPAASATYLPAGWKKRRKRRRKQEGSKRQKGVLAAAAAAPPVAAPPPGTAAVLATPPPNPAQLAPLRCSWPHPAVLELLVQQCWPAAGPAALVQRAGAAASAAFGAWQLGPQAGWWNRMLPSLSLLHPPLSPRQHLDVLATNSGSCSSGGAGVAGSVLRALPLPRPNVLVGYEEDWLELAAEVLPLWQAAPLAPFAGPKALLHYLLCPEQQLAAAQQLIKDVGSVYETCNLGSHMPASADAVRTFQLTPDGMPCPADSVVGGSIAGQRGPQHHQQQQQQQQQQQSLAARYLAGLRAACEELQRQLLLDPPPELQQLQGSSLEDGAEPAVLVYIACPLEAPADHVAALLEAACCLAPCTPLGAACEAEAAADLCVLPHTGSGLDLGVSVQQQQQLLPLAPCEPQQPDRPATTTPATDTSRAPGGSPPPDEAADPVQGAAEQQPEAGQQQQRYHGAAHMLHEQHHGDFRQLPVRRVQRPEGSRPINIVLQVLSPQALADISGTAARCTAFALYSKMRHVPTDSRLEPLAAAEPLEVAPPRLPFCSQPLMVLAPAAAAAEAASSLDHHEQQQQQRRQDVEQPPLPPEPAPPLPPLPPGPGDEQQEDGECTDQQPEQQGQQQQQQELGAAEQGTEAGGAGEPEPAHRTLHCFYSLPPPGCSLLPLAFVDTCGELLHAELLDTTVDRVIGLSMAGIAGSSSDSLVAAAAAAGSGASAIASSRNATARACRLVLRRCLELLGTLRAASSPPGLLHSIAIAGAGMQPSERAAWRELIERDGALPLELPAGAELAVLDVQALHPARFSGPLPPSGCHLLLQHAADAGTGDLQASITWLPPADGTASLLPREHDVVRTLQATLVCRCSAEEAALQEQQREGEQKKHGGSDEDVLCSLAVELHGLAWLHAAFQGACLRAVVGGGPPAAADAHLPLHAALTGQLRALLAVATGQLCPCPPNVTTAPLFPIAHP